MIITNVATNMVLCSMFGTLMPATNYSSKAAFKEYVY